MKITEKTRSTLRYCAAFVLIFGSVTIGERTNAVDSVNPYETFGGDTLRCVIGTGDENYGRNGFRTGFSYDLLRKFGSHVGAEVKISLADDSCDYVDSLRSGEGWISSCCPTLAAVAPRASSSRGNSTVPCGR